MSRKVQKIILLVDTSGSMDGPSIDSVKKAINNFSDTLYQYDCEHTRVDLQIITFATEAKFVSRNAIDSIVADGRTNLADAYQKLGLIFRKHSAFDYRPIVVLFCDGQPNLCDHNAALQRLYSNKEFSKSLRLAFAYGVQDERTFNVLSDFTGNPKKIVKNNNIQAFRKLLEGVIPKFLKRRNDFDYRTRHSTLYSKWKYQRCSNGRYQNNK